MSWVNNLINKTIGLPYKEGQVTKQMVTFKGKATTDLFEISELQRGWEAGFKHAMDNWSESAGGFEPFPGDSAKGFFGNGFAEGVRSGINRHLDRLYPGAKSLSYNIETKKYDATY